MQILRMPLFQLPQLISQLVNAQVAITRLREFLAAAEQHSMPETAPAGTGISHTLLNKTPGKGTGSALLDSLRTGNRAQSTFTPTFQQNC